MPLSGPPLAQAADLPRVLAAGLANKPESSALVSAEGSWSWRQLEDTSDRLARNLLQLGLAPGDRVASLMPNRAALVIHYLACLKAGLVITPLNYRYMPPEIDHALGLSGASILFAHAERAADLTASKALPKLPLGVITYGEARERAKGETFEDLSSREAAAVALPAPRMDVPQFLFFTSGSTGKPKGVTHSLRSFGWVVSSHATAMQLTGDDVVLPGSSISHIGGFMTTLACLTVGARADLARSFDGDELLPLMRQTRPSVLVLLPAALFALLRDHNAKKEDFSSLRFCLSGGDKVGAELGKAFQEMTGFPICEGFGMTEIGVAFMNPPVGLNKQGAAGPLVASYSASVRDEAGAELPIGEEGRLWVKGPAVTQGYWENPEATAETLQDGWLDTGDVMRVDEDGYHWFCGRRKQIIVHDGSNICPQEVEEAVMAHPAVAAAGAVGVHDVVHGENVWAFIALKKGAARPTSQEVIRCARERVGYKAPEAVAILPEIPLNPTGKVDRVTLKKLAAEQVAAYHTD